MNENKLIIETRQLCKNFGPTVALNNVDLKVYRGQITGLIGENGADKIFRIPDSKYTASFILAD